MFYISHDPSNLNKRNVADNFFALFRKYPRSLIALNVKELGYEKELVEYIVEQGVIRQIFLFDMELLENDPGNTAKKIKSLNEGITIAARVSDRNESIDRALRIESADVIWLDEFDRLWATRKDVDTLKRQPKTIYAISPEIHGFTLEQAFSRWEVFRSWGIDGVCTDYAEKLSELLLYKIGGK